MDIASGGQCTTRSAVFSSLNVWVYAIVVVLTVRSSFLVLLGGCVVWCCGVY